VHSPEHVSVQTLNTQNNNNNNNNNKVQELPALGSKVLDIKSPESSSDEMQLLEKQSTPRGPKWDTPGKHSMDFSTNKLGKIVAGGEGKKTYPAR
jgi:hypothetical protein